MNRTITQRIDELSVVIETMRTLTKVKAGWICDINADSDLGTFDLDIWNPDDDRYGYWFSFSFKGKEPHLRVMKHIPDPADPDDIASEYRYNDKFDAFYIHSLVMQIIGEKPFVEIKNDNE